MSVRVERGGVAAVVTIDRPEKRNAIDPEMSARLNEIFTELEDDAEIRVIVITGAGDVFCAQAPISTRSLAAGLQRSTT